MRKTITAALLIALGTVSYAQYSYQKYIPTQYGNNWKFSNGATYKIDDKYGAWAHFNEFWGAGEDYWGRWYGNTFYLYPDNNGYSAPLFKFGAPVGTTYTVDFGGFLFNTKVAVGSKNETVVTPAGVFTKCIRFDFSNPSLYDAGMISIYFAKGIGPVVYSEQSIMGPQVRYLVYAKINGVSYGSSSPITGNISPDDTYVTASSTGFTFDVDYTVTNTSTTGKTLTFSSGKQYDLRIYNAAGSVVYTWSANKYFIQAFTSFTLAAGETKTFQIHNVTNLPDGNYVMKSFLTPTTGETAAAMGQLYVAPPAEPLAGSLDPDALSVGGPAYPGATWTVNYSVKNTSSQSFTLNFNSGQQFDAVIYDSNGQEYWKWSADKFFIMALTVQTWAPGESKTFTLQIAKPGGLGNYTLKVYMLPEKAVATAPITVLP